MAGTPADHLQELLNKLNEHIKQQQTKKALRTADSSESSLPYNFVCMCLHCDALRSSHPRHLLQFSRRRQGMLTC